MMSFIEAVKTCFKKYVTFSGRARRSEFWWFNVLNMILCACATYLVSWKTSAVDALQSQITIETALDEEKYNALLAQAESIDNTFFPIMALIGIIALVLLLPSLAVAVRRLHDTGRSGWLIWLGIIPIVNFVGAIVLLVFNLQDSKPEENKFGPSPKYVAEAVPAAE